MARSAASIVCSFCETEFTSARAIADHLLMCGNKTDPCPICHEYIRRAIFAYHYENNCANPDKPSSNEPTPPESKNSSGPMVTIKCPYCNQNYNKADRESHKATCFQNPDNALKYLADDFDDDLSDLSDPSTQHSNTANGDSRIPCEYCEKGIPWSEYENHAHSCQAEAHRALERKNRRTYRDPGPVNTTPIRTPAPKNTNRKDITIPCLFCKRPMSGLGIVFHQLHCMFNPQRSGQKQ